MYILIIVILIFCLCCYRKEIKQIQTTSLIGVFLLSFDIIQSRFQLFISIISYALLGNNISIRKVKYNELSPKHQ